MAHLRGLKLRLPPVQPRTRRALEAAEFARAQGRFGIMREALFRAFFQEGRDLSSLAVLMQIGASIGLDAEGLRFAVETRRYAAKVIQDEATASDLGITGVPAMVFSRPGKVLQIEAVLSGAQPYEVVQGAISELLLSA
jgi:predicted DsbA family dithiol-disulfide isomerase